MSWEYGFRIESSGRGLRPLGGEERIANRGTELFVLMLAEDRRLNVTEEIQDLMAELMEALLRGRKGAGPIGTVEDPNLACSSAMSLPWNPE